MPSWIEYDPLTGIKETNVADDNDGNILVTKQQDVQPLLDRNAEARNTRAGDMGIKKGLWHYASIPITVQYELLKKGINIHRQEDHAKMFLELETNYPNLKTTNKKHLIGRKRSPKEESSIKPGPFLIVR